MTVLLPVWAASSSFLLAMGLSQRAGSFLERQSAHVLPARLADKVSSLSRNIVYRHRTRLLLSVWAVSLAVQFCRILVYWCAGLAVGLSAGLVYFVAFQTVAAVVAALPISIGRLGVREHVLVGLFHQGEASDNATISAGIVPSLLGRIAFVVRKVEVRYSRNQDLADDRKDDRASEP